MDQNETIFVRVKYLDDFKFVTLPLSDLKPLTFCHRVARTFKFILKEGTKVKLFDNFQTPIPENLFHDVVFNFHRSASFYVEAVFSYDTENVPAIITSFMLKQYIIEKGAGAVLSECTKKNVELTDAQKCHCVNLVADYGVSLFGLNPESHQYINLALAAVDLMPALKSQSGLSTDLLIHSSKNGSGGRLYNRFRYLRLKERTLTQPHEETDRQTNDLANDHEKSDGEQENFDDDLLWLKSVVVTNANLDDVRKILEKTRRVRDEMVKNQSVDYLEHFPVLFVRPDLILDDFESKCKHIHKEPVNANAFLNAWPQMAQRLDSVLQNYYSKQTFSTMWSKEINSLLTLLRLLPFKPGSRSLARSESFQNSINRLLVFSKTNTVDKKSHKNTQPFILACGETQNEIVNFIIYVDNDPIYVPDCFDFHQVIDLYFKLHHVFEIKFDERLQNMFDFMQYYIYGMKHEKPSMKMIELHHRLNLAGDILGFDRLQIE